MTHFLGYYFHGVLFTKFFVYTRHDSVTCIAGALSHSIGCLIKSSSFICSINNDFMKSPLLVVGLESSYLSLYSQMLSPLLLKVSSFRSNTKILILRELICIQDGKGHVSNSSLCRYQFFQQLWLMKLSIL